MYMMCGCIYIYIYVLTVPPKVWDFGFTGTTASGESCPDTATNLAGPVLLLFVLFIVLLLLLYVISRSIIVIIISIWISMST